MRKITNRIKVKLAKWMEGIAFTLHQSVLAEERPNPYAHLMSLRWYERLQVICKNQGYDAAKFAGITGIPKARMEDYFRGLRRPSKDHRWSIEVALATYDVIWCCGKRLA